MVASPWTPGKTVADLAAGAAATSSGAGSRSVAARTVRAARMARAEAAVAMRTRGTLAPLRGRCVLPWSMLKLLSRSFFGMGFVGARRRLLGLAFTSAKDE